jgi:hypothetical protein
MTTTRPISAIAADISTHWTKPYFGAVPYIRAMRSLDALSDNYGLDPATEVLTYFLCNASTWRGDKAREIKAEIKAILGRK